MSNSKKIETKKNLIIQKLGEETLVFDNEKSVLHTFNDTAAFIFKELSKTRSVEEITKRISIKYNVSQKKAEKDISEFITILKEKDLISIK